ncbi:MAG: hypothetical protein ACK4E7_16560 [Permianibacter sp.]
MKWLTFRNIALSIIAVLLLVIGPYIIGVGLIGGAKVSLAPQDWESFSNYFNSISSPFLAAIAAVIAYLSLSSQIEHARKDSSLTSQMSNQLNHIKILQAIIEKRWLVITKVTATNWEEEPFYAINRENIKSSLVKNVYLAQEIVPLCRFFQSLSEATQWYSRLMRQKLHEPAEAYPKSEWSHFSRSLILEQQKKMKFCYEYTVWLLDEPHSKTNHYTTELLIFRQFYENLLKIDALIEP